MKAFTATFTTGLSCPNAKLPVMQGDTLFNGRVDARRALEYDMLGYNNSTTGLGRTYAAGNNPVTFTVYLALSWAEMVDEAWSCFGLGYEQMLDCSFEMKLAADPFKAVNAALSLPSDGVTVKIFPVFAKTDAMQIGVPLQVKDYTNPDQAAVTSDDGLVLSFEDTVNPLGTTDLQTVKVTRGLVPGLPALGLVEADETTPAAIEAAYERAPNTNATEAANTTFRTPLSLLVDQPLSRVQTGKVEAKQIIVVRNWKARALFFPRLSTQQVLELVARTAASLDPGKQLLAVNAATVRGLTVQDEHLPFCGIVCFPQEDARFYQYPGLRCASGGQPVIHMPDALLRDWARKCHDALQPGANYPNGDTGRVQGFYREAVRPFPGAVTDQKGLEVVSWVFSEVMKLIQDATAAYDQRFTQARASLAAKGVKTV